MGDSKYLNYYLEFQERFKPIKHHSNIKDIIRVAIEGLVQVFEKNKGDEFIKRIRLVYPNYFTVDRNGRFVPIKDDIVCFNPRANGVHDRDKDLIAKDEELKNRVLQHMSYYMTGAETQFIRISKSLLENPKLSVNSFYVEKEQSNKYRTYVNKLINECSSPIVPATKVESNGFEFDIHCNSDEYHGEFIRLKDENGNDIYNNYYNNYVFCYSVQGKQQSKAGNIESKKYYDGSAGEFCELFRRPLSAHFVMLEEASLLYVYSQTAQIGKDDSSLGYGGMFVLIDKGLELNNVGEYTRFFRLIGDSISICVAHNIMIERQVQENIKSAIAAIMSRNMSHNLGSHYLYYTKVHLRRLADSIDCEHSPDIRGAGEVLGYTQARMDYLATVISNDKYPYGAVNFKSQLLDVLTIDDFTKRHYFGKDKETGREKSYSRTINFLLANLVRSEDFSRPNILDQRQNESPKDQLFLYVKYSKDGKHFDSFTGTNFMRPPSFIYDRLSPENKARIDSIVSMDKEMPVKQSISRINLALPGGNMSCHAFFNVVENYIRNSAKYLREDFCFDGARKELLTTIALKEDGDFIDIMIYDNKKNATRFKTLDRTKALFSDINKDFPLLSLPPFDSTKGIGSIIMQCRDALNLVKQTESPKSILISNKINNLIKEWNSPCLFEQIQIKLGSISILDNNNALNKENKGLKEMLFSSAWMRASSHPEDKSFTDVIYDIQQEHVAEAKKRLIRDYCFEPVIVEDCGDTVNIYPRADEINSNNGISEDLLFKPVSFGVRLRVPLFKDIAPLDVVEDEDEMIKRCLRLYSDIVKVQASAHCPINLKKAFPRLYCVNEDDNKSVIDVFHEVLIDRFPDFDEYKLSVDGYIDAQDDSKNARTILFETHIKDHKALEGLTDYAYVDSISGANFTKTLSELFIESFNSNKEYMPSEEQKYFCMKIKESALTRITIIDERLSDTMSKEKTELELSLKNIRVLNYIDTEKIESFTELFKGNSFMNGGNDTHFLSIHLGLIEKIINSSEYIDYIGEMSFDERAKHFMRDLEKSYGGFISIHSGRGNFSAELEGPLANYPFVSLSSLENSFNNSKYLLSQLFYNTVYIGKGRINKKQS